MKINQRVLRALESVQEARRFDDRICEQVDLQQAREQDSLSPELEDLLQRIHEDESQNEIARDTDLKRGGVLRRWSKLVRVLQARLGISSSDQDQPPRPHVPDPGRGGTEA